MGHHMCGDAYYSTIIVRTNMTIKKVYTELHALLVANEGKKVSSIMDDILVLMNSKVNDKNHRVDELGNVTHVFCYYHKVWEDVTIFEYGSKVNSTTGLNTMCKIGVNYWTKQQRVYKQSKADLLDQLANGESEVRDLADKLQEIEDAKDYIQPRLEYMLSSDNTQVA